MKHTHAQLTLAILTAAADAALTDARFDSHDNIRPDIALIKSTAAAVRTRKSGAVLAAKI